MFFKKIEAEAAIVQTNGVYKQVDLYERRGELFVGMAGGFVRLMADGSTTKAKTRLDTLSFEQLAQGPTGRLMIADPNNTKQHPLPTEKVNRFLALTGD